MCHVSQKRSATSHSAWPQHIASTCNQSPPCRFARTVCVILGVSHVLEASTRAFLSSKSTGTEILSSTWNQTALRSASQSVSQSSTLEPHPAAAAAATGTAQARWAGHSMRCNDIVPTAQTLQGCRQLQPDCTSTALLTAVLKESEMMVGCTPRSSSSRAFFSSAPHSTTTLVVPSPATMSCGRR